MDTLYPVATDLTEGDPLPGGDEVARYCKPNDYDLAEDKPRVTAFIRRETEDDISVNRLQFFLGHGRVGSVDCIRSEVGKHYELRRNGRFVVLNVTSAKTAAHSKGFTIDIIYTPKPSRPSHSSIVNLPTGYVQEVRLATALLRLITNSDTYQAVL